MTEFYFPKSFSPTRLDRYLSAGWFRSNCAMFRCEYLCIDQRLARVINVRLRLEDYYRRRSHRRIVNRVERHFRYEIKPVEFSAEKQRLYRLTMQRFKGFLIDKLELFLHGSREPRLFNTFEISVYDRDKLVGVSFFDCGKDSIASLLAIYDPEYRDYRLGSYTMVKEIAFAGEQGFRYYYPGYVLDSVRSFDYKLSAGPMQVKQSNNRWVAMDSLENRDELLRESEETRGVLKAFRQIERFLDKKGVPYSRYLNPFFTLGYADYYYERFINSIIALLIPTKESRFFLLFDYDSESGLYSLFLVERTEAYDELKELQDYSYYVREGGYLTDLYVYRELLGVCPDVEGFEEFF